MVENSSHARHGLGIHSAAGFHENTAQALFWAAFRLVIGAPLIVSGWSKIVDPLAQSHFLEGIGLYPGWLFSPLLAVLQFYGGMMICVGFLTRPIAFANAVMLVITLWFHLTHPYGLAFVTDDGLSFLATATHYLTPEGQQRLLLDGGRAFLGEVQEKAVYNSMFWSAGAMLIAAFGAGSFSVDRLLTLRAF